MDYERFIPRVTKDDLDAMRSIINGDGSGFRIVARGTYESIADSDYFGLRAGEVYDFVEERAGGVIVKLRKN